MRIDPGLPELTFENPWLLLAAVPALAAALWLMRRTGTPLPTLRRAIGGAGLAAAVVALILASAGVSWIRSDDTRTVWVILDRSLSVGTSGEAFLPAVLEDLAGSLPDGDYVGVIAFDESARVILEPRPAGEIPQEFELPDWEPSDETYMGAALELAARRTVPGTAPFAILIGDGHDSVDRYGGDVLRQAADSGVRIFPMPVDSEPLPEAAVADFSVRLVGREQRVLAVDLVVFSTVEQVVTPQVKVNGEDPARIESDRLDAQGRLRVGVGHNPVRLRVQPAQVLPMYLVEVSLAAAQNTFPRNDSARLSVRGPGDSRVLLIHGDRGDERSLERALGRIGLDVTTGPPGILPSDPIEIAQYQVVILSDVPATDFSSRQHEMIEQFTRAGGGLAMIGGADSFAPGGWHGSAVERVLPVTGDVTEKGRKQTPALVVALDRSGSMGAEVGRYTKMELANEGCVRSIRLVPPGGFFGMLSVDTHPDWIVPLEKLSLEDRNGAIERARGNALGGGGIYVDVALKHAVSALLEVEASSRHVVLFADANDTENQEGMREYVERMHREREITFSTIALGSGVDEGFLREIAEVHGGGRFFPVQDAADLPAIFSRETALSSGNFLRERAFRPWHGRPGSLTDGVDFESEATPELLGYVATTARDESHVWLWADEDKERPLLATWNVELGKALAFTSDAKDRWGDRWLPWTGYDELWQRWIHWLLPEPEEIHGVESSWTVDRSGPVLDVSFFGTDGEPRRLQDPVASISTPGAESMDAEVVPVGSGAYRVRFPRNGSGVYEARIREYPDDADPRLVAREHRIVVPLDELMHRPADEATLHAIGEATGGAMIRRAREVLSADATGGSRRVNPDGELLWIAVIGLFMGIGARRFPSVWRRHGDERRRADDQQARTDTAHEAYARVRQALRKKSEKAPPRRVRSDRYGPAEPPAPRAELPGGTRPQSPEKSAEGSLLSAIRKARKELKDQTEDPD